MCSGKAAIVRWYESPLGRLLLASDGSALTGAWFERGHKYFAHTLAGELREGRASVLDEACAWLDRYFSGSDPGPIPPVALAVTPFRRMVCEAMCEIPYGQTTTYGAIAASIALRGGSPSSARAVGGAVGHNPVSIFIPCHRVVGADCSLTGYAGGMERKTALLELEGIDLSAFRVPMKGTAL